MWLEIESNQPHVGDFSAHNSCFYRPVGEAWVDKFKKICKISFCFRYVTFLLHILIFFNEYVMVKNPGF